MVVVPAGNFEMGSVNVVTEMPMHQVTIARFAIGKTEVTQKQWRTIMDTSPSGFPNCGDCPVEKVSWNDAQEYLQRISKISGQTYRLPTESEWEYSCRAGGSKSSYCGSEEGDDVAWHLENSGGTTHGVAKKKPNAFGLYDMSGNVWEWVQDCWTDNYQGASAIGGARFIPECPQRVLRGGSWSFSLKGAKVSKRKGADAIVQMVDIGFRVARNLP